jgi:hypothetical protein
MTAAPSTGHLPRWNAWADADFADPRADRWPAELLALKRWMGHVEKRPFAPWAERDHPEAGPDEDARWKWGLRDNYLDGERMALAEADPRLDGRVFIQRADDPYAFVDGDDVRCPETGAVHPVFVALLEHLGRSYADVSTSGTGVHAYYRGDLPLAGKGQVAFEIDTNPWGANDAPPTVEIYANKHVCVATGAHVPGSGTEITAWDTDSLRAVLEAHGYRDEEGDHIVHDTDRDRPDLAQHTPTATHAEQQTTDVRDVLLAVDRLRPADLRLQTRPVGTDATGWEIWDPSTYRTSAGGESLHRPPGESVFYDHKHGESFGVLGLLAAEEGIVSAPWDRLAGADWWAAVEAAREAGAPIPEFVGGQAGIGEPIAVLPPAVRDLATTTAWDWRHAGREEPTTGLSLQVARDRTTAAIAAAYRRGERALVEALPTTGKSYGCIKAAAEENVPITVLTGRGHKEQYQQFREWADEFGLDAHQLPAFTQTCPTARGDHGREWRGQIMDWYRRGASPQTIHNRAESALGRPLPCQVAEDGDPVECPHRLAWKFNPEDYNVLIGHYTHAHTQQATRGRIVVFDEFPGGAFEAVLAPAQVQGAISHYLSVSEAIPFSDYTDLVEHRRVGTEEHGTRRADALTALLGPDGVLTLEPDEDAVFETTGAHALAPHLTATLLIGEDLGNGFERADLGAAGCAAFNRQTGSVAIQQPPTLEAAAGVVALDGTPTPEMWTLALDERLRHRPVLSPAERVDYLERELNLQLVRTTDAVKPYNSAAHVNTAADAALLEEIATVHGQRPAVITTATAETEYEAAGIDELFDESAHYGNVLGSNAFDDTRLGVVIGSNHYGDDFLKKWGAYADVAVERNGEKGAALSYGEFGDRVLRHMREHETLQAAMRFGRDGHGAVVYVHTDTLPDWVPLAGEGRVLTVHSDGMRAVVDVLAEAGEATTAEIVAHAEVDISRRQVFRHLEALRARGVLAREQDLIDGRRVRWHDEGLHRIKEHGEAELPTVGVEELDDREVREVARSTVYTWDFRNTVFGGCNESPPPAVQTRGLEAHPSAPGGPPRSPPDTAG